MAATQEMWLRREERTSDGIGLATFMLGDVTSFNRYVSSSTNAQEHQKRMFWYGQDEWHVNPKLTFTYGLRWEMVFPETVNAQGNGAELDVNTGEMDVFGIGLDLYSRISGNELARVRPARRVCVPDYSEDGYSGRLWLDL